VCRYWPPGNIIGRQIYEVEDSILYRVVDSSWLYKTLVIFFLLLGVTSAYVLIHSEIWRKKIETKGTSTNEKEDSETVEVKNTEALVETNSENKSLENDVHDSYLNRLSTAILSIFNQSESTNSNHQ